MIIDVHAHLEFKQFDKDRDLVMGRARKAGVNTIICNGTDPETNRKILLLSKKYDLIKAALGYYPSECDKISKEDFEKEIEFIKNNNKKIIAIGEVGLDRKYINDFEKQRECFKKLIKLSKELHKPIIVHSRFAEEQAINILEQEKAEKVVMHCFSGSKELVKRCINNKWSFSIPCNVVRSQQFQEMVEMIPLKQILTETDSPFLTHDSSIKRNEPMYIKESLKKIAEIKELEVEELENMIYANYQRIFL
ncbi:MAG: TatD family hydrolase [Nanoarchaeota archaeon]|nr:TatD family hydrolase [Nanoarchaeota archaeon]MBU1854537.1 TatD family hydrolase [Nanoarchaeota archaeon]